MIRKEAFINEAVMKELKRMIEDSEIMKYAAAPLLPSLSPC